LADICEAKKKGKRQKMFTVTNEPGGLDDPTKLGQIRSPIWGVERQPKEDMGRGNLTAYEGMSNLKIKPEKKAGRGETRQK